MAKMHASEFLGDAPLTPHRYHLDQKAVICMRKLPILALTCALAFALVGCGEKETPSSPDATDTPTAEVTPEPEPVVEPEPAAEPTPTTHEINQIITDEALGYTVVVKQAIIDIPYNNPDAWANGYRTAVAVEIELQNNSELTGYLNTSDVRLLVGDRKISPTDSSFSNFADANNLEPFAVSGVTSGETATGWMFFSFETANATDGIFVVYTRDETRILDLSTSETVTLPAMELSVKLPY